MTTQEVANRLVALCREGNFSQAYEELYSPDIHSIEVYGEPREVRGFEAVKGKSEYFEKTMEMHSMEVSAPVVAGNFFSVSMEMDATNRENGQREPMNEICVYEVNDGKIVREQFFYPAMS